MSHSKEMRKSDKKPSNSYSMLSQKMSEVQNSKRSGASSSRNDSNHSSTRPSNNSSMSGSNSFKQGSSSSDSKKKSSQNNDPNEPDRSFGDYYCPICDSHMNSDAMWEAHITGKRHIKNVKKGDIDSKYEDLENVESNIKYELRNVKDPIIGLNYIHEIRRKEPNVPPMYNCFLCHATMSTAPIAIEHVISLKHRQNYMKENNTEEYQLMESTHLKKGQLEVLLLEAAVKMEQRDGRGVVKVKQEKLKVGPAVTYRRQDKDDDDKQWKSSKDLNTDKSWKPFDSEKRNSRSDRSRSPIDRRKVYPDDDLSMDSYKRSALARKMSPKRDDYYRSSSDLDYSRNSDLDYSRKTGLDYSRKSDRDDYTRKSDRDDYSRKSEYDRHPRIRSPTMERSDYNLSPIYDKTDSYSKELSKKESYPRNQTDDIYQLSRPQTQDNYLLPHERSMEQFSRPSAPLSYPDMLKDFVQKVFALPTEIFLKLVISRMENMELKGIEELNLLSRVINKGQVILCNKLPPDLRAILRERVSHTSENNNSQRNIPGLGDMMMSSAMPSPLPPSAMPSSMPPSAMPSSMPPSAMPSSAMPSSAMSNISSGALDIQSFLSPSMLSNQTTYKPPSTQNVQSNANFIRDILQSVNRANSTSSNANTPTPQNVNQYQSGNSSTQASFQTGAANVPFKNARYPPVQRYPYTNTQPNTASAIPGLTLTDQTPPAQAPPIPESQQYNNYQRFPPPANQNQNFPYRY